ncbi:nucleoside-diphosphate-sugar epimerase [Variovorax boronicumulans]|uniref:NAD-dependent epimerase/dehydratase family protein n=1 Tax=Variovorax boronicumulans TaxID=436515 RepID=UPI002789B34F|nr:NAD-dependent epimerase/dehydratase family protein [Variovorax boronicumulans]MDP9916406.1 nucleoside-diphosphate-sugar epimerase [Variovorax boronicumulans]
MKILVTGGNGFVGRALMAHLQAHGLEVVCAVRNNAGLPANGSSILVGDIDAYTDWRQALEGVDVIVHLAGRAHRLQEEAANPSQEFRRVNVDGTLNLGRQALMAGVRRLLFISSIGVLGTESSQPFKETDSAAPAEPYALSKWEAEKELTKLTNSSSMELVIIRPPLIYGADAPGNFGRIVHALKKGFILPLGAVHNQRTLISLWNLIDLIHCCIDHPAAANEIFLAGDAEDVSTTKLLRRLGQVLGCPARLVPVPVWLLEPLAGAVGRKTMVRKLCGDLQVDIGKARQLLNWEPPLSFDDGLLAVAGKIR